MLLVAALTGLVTVDVLKRLVRRTSFWVVCILLGGLAVVGSVALYSGWNW